MKIARYSSAAALVILAAVLAAQAAPAGGPARPAVEIRFVADPLMMCHFYLKNYGPSSSKPRDDSQDFISEATAYTQAVRLITVQGVWKWLEEQIAAHGDPAGVRKAAADLPATIQGEENRTAVNMLVDALESAYPKYRKTVFAIELEGLNRVMVGAKKRYLAVEERITQALMEQMSFEAITRPITVYVVVRTGGVASWGVTEETYFTVVGSFGQSPMSLVESGIHESTHIIDALQSYNSGSVLSQVRRTAKEADRQDLELFLHGLVAFNSGELVKRFLSNSYRHAGIRAPGLSDKYQPYLSTYEFIWTDYMDGKIPAKGIAAKLVEEFEAVQALHAGQPGS